MTATQEPSVDELLAAYADDPASLSPAERASIEARLARDPAAAREVEELRALLGDVRVHGDVADRGPDWSALEASIRAAVTPAPRRGRWAAAGVGLALAAAAGLALWWHGRAAEPAGGPWLATLVPVAPASQDAPVPGVAAADDEGALDDDAVADEVALELDDADDLGGELELGDIEHEALLGAALERVPVAELEAEDGLFPGLDTAWLDDLSETEVEQALRWLDQQGAG